MSNKAASTTTHAPTLPPLDPVRPGRTLDDQIEAFSSRFPGGFAGPTYRSTWGERGRGRQRLASSLHLGVQLLETSSARRASELCIELFGSTKLVQRRHHRAVSSLVGDGRERFGAAVLELVQGDGGHRRRFRHWLGALDRLGLDLGWTGCTAPLAFTDPQRHMLVRLETARLQARVVHPCHLPRRPTPHAYREARRIGRRTREQLIARGLHPSSLLDVHVFVEHVHRSALRARRQRGQRSGDSWR